MFFFLFFSRPNKCFLISPLICDKLADQNNVSFSFMFQGYDCSGAEITSRCDSWRKTPYYIGTIEKQTENRNSCCARSFLLKSGWIGESIPGMNAGKYVQNNSYHRHFLRSIKDNSLSDCLHHRLYCEYKEGKAFRYFSCDFIKEIYFLDISNTCPYYFLRTRETPA